MKTGLVARTLIKAEQSIWIIATLHFPFLISNFPFVIGDLVLSMTNGKFV